MDFKALISQLVTLYSKLSKNQRIIVASAIVAIVSFLLFLVVYTNGGTLKNNYVVLFENLSANDAAKVIEQLEKDQIPYKIPRENVITVPRNTVYKERIVIASAGIAQESGVGFELFDKQEFGATSFDQNVKYMRAVEGELSRTITALEPVERCDVSLAIAKESLFISKEVAPTASIMVKLKEGRALSRRQVRGIKNLVAASVPKLLVANVTLVNVNGETLGDANDESAMGELSMMQQKYKVKQEKNKEKKIITVLAPFIGGHKRVVATVTIEYDFSQSNSTSEVYDPDSVVRSEQSTEEKREGFSPKEVGGVPGAVSNIGPVQGLDSQQKSESYTKNDATTNYEISKTVSTRKSEFATLKRMSAAVVVDGKYKPKLDEDGEAMDELEYVALDKSQLDAIRSLVIQSIGVDERRGDTVSVKNFQFEISRGEMKEADGFSKITTASNKYLTPFMPIFKYLFVGLLLFIVYKKVIAPFSQRMLEFSKEEDDIQAPILNIEDDEEEDLIEKVSQMRKKVEDQLGVGDNFNEDELKHEVLLEKVKNIVEEKPEDVASLIQALLDEELNNNEGPPAPPPQAKG